MNEDRQAEALAEAKIKAEQTAQAFLAVFGSDKKRTAHQATVLAHLETCASDDSNSYQFAQARDGISIIAAGLHRDGAKSLLRVIKRQVEIAANVAVKPAKTNVRK